MTPRFYREAEVAQLLDMSTAVETVDECLKQLSIGGAENVPRRRSRTAGFVLHSMSATAGYLNVSGWKQYVTTKAGHRFHVGLYDCESGRMKALIEADRLGQLRTGAATGVAARYLAAGTITQLGLFGTGWQAEAQLAAVNEVHPLTRAFVYSRDEERRQSFAARMSEELNLEILPVHDPREAVEDLPLVITATASKTPVFDGSLLAEGALVCAIGSNWLQKAELDVAAVRLADNIVCDSIEACKLEAGDFVAAQESGDFDWDKPVELGDVLANTAVGRNNKDSVVIFKSVGLAIEDVALAERFYQRAVANPGLGVSLPL
ncbi:MAG: ornithine cyclodeaminase family protein [Blastopirellula sp. JB062]